MAGRIAHTLLYCLISLFGLRPPSIRTLVPPFGSGWIAMPAPGDGV